MPTVPMSQVIRRLDEAQVDHLYILFGNESYLQQEYLNAITDRILKDALRDFNHDIFNANTDGLIEALSLARTLPMMAPYRVVVLHGLDQLRKADWPPLQEYLKTPSKTTALVCSTADSDLNKLPKAVTQNAITIACKRLEGGQLQKWVMQQVQQQHAQITSQAVTALLQDHDNDLQMLAQEVTKLCTYAGEGGEIALADVQAVSQSSRHHSIFAITDALGARQVHRALATVERLIQQGEPPLVILSMMIRHVRLLWSIKHLARQRQDLGRVAKTLGLPQTVCRQLMAHSRQISTTHLERMYEAAVDADLAFKTSNNPPQAILEGFIFALCAGP